MDKYSKYLVKDSSLIISGKIGKDDDKSLPKILVDKIIPLNEIRNFIQGINIKIDTNTINKEMIDDLINFANSNIGKHSLQFSISDKGNNLNALSKKFHIAINRQNFKKLENIFGQGNINYVFKQF